MSGGFLLLKVIQSSNTNLNGKNFLENKISLVHSMNKLPSIKTKCTLIKERHVFMIMLPKLWVMLLWMRNKNYQMVRGGIGSSQFISSLHNNGI